MVLGVFSFDMFVVRVGLGPSFGHVARYIISALNVQRTSLLFVFFLLKIGPWFKKSRTEFAKVKDSLFVYLERASTGSGGATFCVLLCFDRLLLAVFSASSWTVAFA